MSRRHLIRRTRARLHGERGFTILETVIALMVVFASLTALAYTASIGFRYSGYGRDRIQASGIANRIMEDIRGLAYTKITNGIPTHGARFRQPDRDLLGHVPIRVLQRREDRLLDLRRRLHGSVAQAAHGNDVRRQPRRHLRDLRHQQHADHDSVPGHGDRRVEQRRDQRTRRTTRSRLQSLFWSPSGCVNPSTHPFAAPCQPFFYGQVDAPQPRLDVTGQLHDFAVDFDSLALTAPGHLRDAQEEQTTQLNATTTLSGHHVHRQHRARGRRGTSRRRRTPTTRWRRRAATTAGGTVTNRRRSLAVAT